MSFIMVLTVVSMNEKTMNYLDDNIHVFDLYDCRNSTSVVFNEETAKNPKLFSGKHQCR